MADAISIEETNKIRVAIGLKPLPVPGAVSAATPDESDQDGAESTLQARTEAALDNWQRHQTEIEAKAKKDARLESIKKARDAAQRFARLEGRGLGDDDSMDVDAKSWLKQSKQRQRKLARKYEQELAEREAQTALEHTAEDLAGVKVAHELYDFDEGGEAILTLKDTTIDQNEEEGDELEDLGLVEKDRLRERIELKKKKPVYNPLDEEESGQKTILGHYDEAIDGKKRNRFTLDSHGRTDAGELQATRKNKPMVFSLDILKGEQNSDYLDQSTLKIKKPKKKKVKSTRKKAADEDDILPEPAVSYAPVHESDVMDTEHAAGIKPAKKRAFQDTSFIDDDDLQASLAFQRRNALKKRKIQRPEDIARQVREEAFGTPASDANMQGADDAVEEPGLVIDETSEFVANLQKPTIPEQRRKPEYNLAEAVTSMAESPPDTPDAEGDISMEPSYQEIDHDRHDTDQSNAANLTSTGLDDETTLTQGVGSTLAMLTQRGLIKHTASSDLNELQRERLRFQAEKRRREMEAEQRARQQRERDRASGKFDRMSARDREQHAQWENKARDQKEARDMAEVFNKAYKPDVDLKYVDEFGRHMNQKEAFKHLSHQFHGKGSGKQKTEKRLKKIEDEKKREAMSSLDSSQQGMSNTMASTAKKSRQAGVRLA